PSLPYTTLFRSRATARACQRLGLGPQAKVSNAIGDTVMIPPKAGLEACATLLFIVVTATASAQPQTQTTEADPVQCWWRTSAGAVRVGETFTLVLTCAALETDEVKVVVDQSKLEPSVVQFAPFEVTGGSHAADLRSGDRRFFQYEYRLRAIAEILFGKDVQLPETKVSYRV